MCVCVCLIFNWIFNKCAPPIRTSASSTSTRIHSDTQHSHRPAHPPQQGPAVAIIQLNAIGSEIKKTRKGRNNKKEAGRMGGGWFFSFCYYCHFGVFVLAAVFSNRQQTVSLSLSLSAPISSCRVYHVVMRAPLYNNSSITAV